MSSDNTECCNLNLIVTDFYDQLKKYLVGKVRNYELAEDIVQEVMLKVVTAHHKNLQVKNLRAWIFQIARNSLIDYYRKDQKNLKEYEDFTFDEFFGSDDQSLSSSEYMIPMINLLPQEYRVPLLLSDIESLPQAIIANKLGLSLSATKMRIQRARKKLYNLFIECCDIKYSENGALLHCSVKKSCVPLQKMY
ncbi:MAG: sigma-70 family RNA polymerase sigma factor [Bacteroidales bacterium]|jgi:RNA polymerase sigma-70 factor (ECF subfamily)|nr:sigma-70 family RNA polymerase sigma factor [Bacteroidales bacterium]MDD2265021.1 sigma-70 family RNA polymerase sigma factor [Bacteroidales bacterium]MDD2832207.1 sigma-70 family RNA polymerase sigma factor [Bacteroidales bacterium]MDD4474009.1 sigma-70 family RNA polymerase sigma factor [Bacteroidales bacterium]MDD5046986.1 sigma-70 family RNA polymerase sigma factor [Bacteroidales bacterium]